MLAVISFFPCRPERGKFIERGNSLGFVSGDIMERFFELGHRELRFRPGTWLFVMLAVVIRLAGAERYPAETAFSS